MTSHALPRKVAWFARLGYVARGVVYALIGVLALDGSARGADAAMATITQQPFGKFLMGLLVAGLIAYALWRFYQAIADPDNEGDDGKALAKRFGRFVSGLLYGALAWLGIAHLTGGGRDSGGQDLLQRVMGWEYGEWVIGAIALGTAITGLYQVWKGWTADFDRLDIPADKRSWAIPVCRIGVAARGVVWLVISWLFVEIIQRSQAQPIGIGEALQQLQSQTGGRWALAAVAAGLIAFGIYSFLQARYRRIEDDSGTGTSRPVYTGPPPDLRD